MTAAPKAVAGGTSGGVAGLLVVWLLGRFGIPLGAEEGAAIASASLSAGAVVAHYGLIGLARRLLWGDRS